MRDSRRIDQQSREAIREDLLANILVEAGAGSGKTQMLAERMAAGVAAGVYDIERMAAVTFTRKAASELRGRFHLALEKQLQQLSDGIRDSRTADRGSRAAACQRLSSALANLERFFAGTIHSFCARLLRERPVEAGISPGFTELEELQDAELRKKAWREFIVSARAAGEADMAALLDAEIRPKDLDNAFATICLHEDVEFEPGDAECPDVTSAVQELEVFWKALLAHLPSRIEPDTNCPIQIAAQTFEEQLRVHQYHLHRPSVVAALLATWNCPSEIKQYRWADSAAGKKRFKHLINPLHEAFKEKTVDRFLGEWRQYVYRLSVSLLTRARDRAAQERRRLNTLNYGDLLNLTARVLRENRGVRFALQQKYRHLFVDEFQDTDPVQAEIVFLLAAEETDADRLTSGSSRKNAFGSSADWRTVPLRQGALFVVGDPKQSIYRFRRADIDIYNLVRERLSDSGTGRVLPLTMNFRSDPALCGWANAVFEQQFPAAPTPHAPRFSPLDAGAESTAGAGLFTITHATDDYRQVQLDDAEAIARFVRAEVDAKRRCYSDFLILTRKKGDRIAPYARAFEALNIPVEVSGAGAFGESVEVEALAGLLRALADPQDQLALIAVLRGPLFGVSDPELFDYKQHGGWLSLHAGRAASDGKAVFGNEEPESHAGTLSVTEGDRLRPALSALSKYHRWTQLLPAPAALERILEHTGYLALAATTPDGSEAGDLLHAVDRVRQVVEEGGSLSDAVDALADDIDDTTDVESLPLEPGRTDVVRVMNLHKAKGLEAGVVFLADPCGGVGTWIDVHINREGEKAKGWFKLERRSESSWAKTLLGHHKDWPQHEAAEQPYLDAEVNRLLYVAATRARQMLVVSRWTGRLRNPAWGVLNEFLDGASELPVPPTIVVHAPIPLDCSVAAQANATAARVAAHERVKQPSWSITSATAEARHVDKMTRAVDAAADDPTVVVSKNTPTHRADAGLAWGTLIHGLLEHAMRFPNSTADDMRRLAMWLTVEEPQLRAVIDDAIETVQCVAKAEFWAEAQAGEHYEEAPFGAVEGQALTSGVIDLLFESAGRWRIRDYKTDSALDAAAYTRQLGTYRQALRQIGCDGADGQLVHVRSQ